tara:strand:+ start:7524 stop:7787 length:264 start_codon:yes stop_codon:yes gene_type:complete
MEYTFPAALEPFMMLYHHNLITQSNPLWEPLNNMVVYKSDLDDFYWYLDGATDETWIKHISQCVADTIADLDKLVTSFLSENNPTQQ